jgi:hypothetical protein
MNQKQEQFPIKVGHTCVRVMRKDINERDGRETVVKIHEGVVIQDCTSFVRVYSPAPIDKGGDVSPEAAQTYPLKSKRMWCEFVCERATKFPIPPLFR